MQWVVDRLIVFRRLASAFGPYLMVEIVMPGGTLLVVLFFLYRRWRAGASTGAAGRCVIQRLGRFVERRFGNFIELRTPT